MEKTNFFKEIFKFALIVLLIVIPVRLYVAQPFIVNGSSMDPTFATGQYLIIDEISYRFKNPNRGDVIVFRYPNNPKQFFIKRIIGLPEETVELKGSEVRIKNNTADKNEIILKESYLDDQNFNYTEITKKLTKDEYFVMGDNRASSFDSRSWGSLNNQYIIGRALLRLFPPKSIALYPGIFKEIEQ